MNRLYFGDNLLVLRESIKDESVDLVYLDPPFNSNANYNVLFKSPKGHKSAAQITAFEDSWHWGEQAEREFDELLHGPNTDISEMIASLRKFLGDNDMMAYLTMITSRLVELHRVLKSTGSLYLHCDSTASHYLKLVLDGIFGINNCRNEIIWKRNSAHSDARQGARHFGRVTDTILFYCKSDESTFRQLYRAYDEEYVARDYRRIESDGRRYRLDNIQGPGGAEKGNPYYEVMGVSRHWRYSKERMNQLIREGRIIQTRVGAVPQYKRYLDEMPGVAVQNLWDDISVINNRSKEGLGYPTQKPVALLERILESSSKKGDVVLDPFCGCGTAVYAAQKLDRQWIGIDVTHLAIAIVEKRLRGAFPRITFNVIGTPTDLDGANDLASREKYEFQYWACSLVNAQPYQQKKKGADGGIDGLIYFQDDKGSAKRIVVSVKGGQNVSVQMIRDLRGVVEREKAAIGIFVTLVDPTGPMRAEATKAGFYVSPQGKKFSKLQILTIEGLLKGLETPKYLDLSVGRETFKRIRPEEQPQDQHDLFSSEESVEVAENKISILKRRPPIRAGKPMTRLPSNRVAAAASRRPKTKHQ
jgi:DNA modification methylase